MNQILERLKGIISNRGLTPRAFALKIGFNYSTLNNYLTGRRTTIDLDLITKTASSFDDISAEWLLRGHGEMFKVPVTKSVSGRETMLIDALAMQQETINELKSRIKRLEAELIIANSRNRIV